MNKFCSPRDFIWSPRNLTSNTPNQHEHGFNLCLLLAEQWTFTHFRCAAQLSAQQAYHVGRGIGDTSHADRRCGRSASFWQKARRAWLSGGHCYDCTCQRLHPTKSVRSCAEIFFKENGIPRRSLLAGATRFVLHGGLFMLGINFVQTSDWESKAIRVQAAKKLHPCFSFLYCRVFCKRVCGKQVYDSVP